MFQFQCPQCANILQADPAQAGQQSQCPICQALFIIPTPVAAPPASGGTPASGGLPHIPAAGASAPQENLPWTPSRTPAPAPIETKEPEILHIPCPKCQQVLETPEEMLDQEVLCPFCEAQFCLQRRDSLESQRRREQELQMRERRASKMWFNWSIVAVVLVVIFLLFLVFSAGRR
jgi:DNA-directed RNA polymerase subunit M/transcription elongation factor TFIIS